MFKFVNLENLPFLIFIYLISCEFVSVGWFEFFHGNRKRFFDVIGTVDLLKKI